MIYIVMFDQYPKVRTPLPEAYQAIYDEHYRNNREGNTQASGLAQKMERWLHIKVAEDLQGRNDLSTLEIGAGTLNQLDYENTGPYDIVEPYEDLFKGADHLSRIRNIYSDISEINGKHLYDRITAIATFEHITDLPQVVARSAILLKDTGTLRVSIPNEGTLLWTLGWKLTTGLEFRWKYGLKYSTLMHHEHVNTAREIEEVLQYFFEKVKCHVFGLNKALAFYRFYECSKARTDRASKFLQP